MSLTVFVTERAEQELHQAADWIAKDAPEAANRWFNGFVNSLLSLSDNPLRCSRAREDNAFPFELRQLLYGSSRSYRALFTIRHSTVFVLSIRHSARRDLTPEDL